MYTLSVDQYLYNITIATITISITISITQTNLLCAWTGIAVSAKSFCIPCGNTSGLASHFFTP